MVWDRVRWWGQRAPEPDPREECGGESVEDRGEGAAGRVTWLQRRERSGFVLNCAEWNKSDGSVAAVQSRATGPRLN